MDEPGSSRRCRDVAQRRREAARRRATASRCRRSPFGCRRGSFQCRLLAGFCSLWLLGIVLLRLTGPLEGQRYVIFLILGAGLMGFSFLSAVRCRMAF